MIDFNKLTSDNLLLKFNKIIYQIINCLNKTIYVNFNDNVSLIRIKTNSLLY